MGCVADLEYVITGQDGQWRLWWQGQCCGSFPSRRAALGLAAYEAARVRLLGHHVRILVRRPDGGYRVLPLPRWPQAEALPRPPGAAAPPHRDALPPPPPPPQFAASRGQRRTRAVPGLAPA